VTEQNRVAVQLYESLGFTVRHRFDAMVRERYLTRRDGSAPRA
jgi:ribosomal protein S18 acetylase RimI-like enzyme